MHRHSLLSTLIVIVFMLAACQTFVPPADSASTEDDIIIADFEWWEEGYREWKVEGDAFGEMPVEGTLPNQMDVSGYLGELLVNSYRGGDGSTGTLTSPSFKIERRYINFLIGGGGFEGETCMNLLIDGKVARTATGPNTEAGGSEVLSWHSWNVEERRGDEARIQIVDNRTGGWGHITVDHIVQSNSRIEILKGVARDLVLDDKYLIFPVKNDALEQVLMLEVQGEKVREMVVNLAPGEPDFWVYVEIGEFEGKEATLSVDNPTSTQLNGFFAIRQDNTYPGEDELYTERLRPQIHFGSKRGWNNDPNGMMYYAGEYHLFYQHNPFGWPWGNMTWGHAVSTDLVHWTELGDALHPDKLGTMFSGSGVVDWNNTTGFQTGDDPPLICIYTNAGGTNPWSEGKPYTQGIAYSNDRGRTWTKYEGNPVQGHINGGNRDPKVIWWEETNEWVIVLYLSDSRMAFFRSPDLKRWELQSVLQSFHECPELFQLAVDGDEHDKKWILYGAAGEYSVGDFDGSEFKPETEAIRYNYGNCFYASQTFSDIPEEDGRRIQIAWGQVDLPGMPFNQMMDFPVELTLHSTEEGLRMFAEPVEEIELLHKNTHEWNDETIEPGENLLAGIDGELFHIRAEFELGDADELGFSIRGVPVTYNVEEERLSCKRESAALNPVDGRIRLELIVDRVSIEIFANDGRVYMPMRALPEDEKGIGVFTRGGDTKLTSIEVNELNSIW